VTDDTTPRFRFITKAMVETGLSRDQVYRYVRNSETTADPVLTDTIEGRMVVDIVSLQRYAATTKPGRPRKSTT
jgi:hypothetical protein